MGLVCCFPCRELFVPYPKQKRALGFRRVFVKNHAMPAQIISIMTSSNESLPIKRQDSAKELKREVIKNTPSIEGCL